MTSLAEDVLNNPRHVTSPTFRRALTEMRARDIAPARDIVFVYDSDSIVDAFKGLVEKQILSMPVYRRHTEDCIGFIDILDILAFVVLRLRELGQVDPLVAMRTWHKLDTFVVTPVSAAINASGRDIYATISQDAHLQQVLDLMISRRVHRVGILDARNRVVNILTQTRILDFVLSQETKGVSLGPMELEDIGHYFPNRPVMTAPLNARAIDAFVFMIDAKVSALAVCNDGGQLVGNISASDFKEIGYDMDLYQKLFMNVFDFLKNKKVNRNVGPTVPSLNVDLPPPILLGPGNKITHALEVFNRLKVHRIYIVDQNYRPINVITPAEILNLFTRDVAATSPAHVPGPFTR